MEIKIIDSRITRPEYATEGSAAFDLRACSIAGEQLTDAYFLRPGETVMIGTGIAIDLGGDSWHVAGLILPRSGIGCKGLKPANSPGLADMDYLGEIKVCLLNQSNEPKQINPLDRIAQYAIVPIIQPKFRIVKEFTRETERGEGGFGHTGVQ
jgi:dUTP pyrophosphatase